VPGFRVLVGGMPVAVTGDQIVVAGCALTGTGAPPCTAVTWMNTAARILVSGRAPLLQAPPGGSGNGSCVGSPPPAIPLIGFMQARVQGM
jgi:hypothetical protein